MILRLKLQTDGIYGKNQHQGIKLVRCQRQSIILDHVLSLRAIVALFSHILTFFAFYVTFVLCM